MRIPTGLEYKPELVTKDLQFIDSYENGQLMELRNEVDTYITRCYILLKEINQQDCLRHLKQSYNENIKVKDRATLAKSVLDYYNDFINFKSDDLNHYNSVKVYKSLQKNLIDFNDVFKLTIENLNKDNFEFFIKFKNYSYETLNHIDNTVSKNIAILKSFLKFLQKKTRYIFKTELFDYKVTKHKSQVVTLSNDEIKEIYYYQNYNKFEKQIIDVFIFLCMTSLRYCDYKSS